MADVSAQQRPVRGAACECFDVPLLTHGLSLLNLAPDQNVDTDLIYSCLQREFEKDRDG